MLLLFLTIEQRLNRSRTKITKIIDRPGEEEEPGEGEDGEREDAPGRPVGHRVQRAEHQAYLTHRAKNMLCYETKFHSVSDNIKTQRSF